MRIAIVNDMLLAVEALRRVVCSVPGHSLAWVATDGAQAVERCRQDKPDLILMDLLMPVMDGAEACRQIMRQTPCPILVVTATVTGNISKVYEAMGYGALDAVNTPVLGPGQPIDGAAQILEKIANLNKILHARKAPPSAPSGPPGARGPAGREVRPILAIGASTGGPRAVADLLMQLPADFAAPILIVQHIGAEFAPGLADWLSDVTNRRVKVAAEGDRPLPGTALLAGTNDHLTLLGGRSLAYTRFPLENPNRPSVDVLFDALAAHWNEPSVAVLLTGMGRDGAAGLLSLKQAGWHTIAQNEATSVVFGMPRAAIELGAANSVLPLNQIGRTIVSHIANAASSRAKP